LDVGLRSGRPHNAIASLKQRALKIERKHCLVLDDEDLAARWLGGGGTPRDQCGGTCALIEAGGTVRRCPMGRLSAGRQPEGLEG
jgi:hypothetical protein